jgi:myo-inositol-1-phosphate synthase
LAKIKVAITGVGNCCSAFVQGIQYHNCGEATGLLHEILGGYSVSDIEIVAAFDIDRRKVGLDLADAIMSEPNKTPRITEMKRLGVEVKMGLIGDSFENSREGLIDASTAEPVDVAATLRKSGAHVLVNLISGSALDWGDGHPHSAPRVPPLPGRHNRRELSARRRGRRRVGEHPLEDPGIEAGHQDIRRRRERTL